MTNTALLPCLSAHEYSAAASSLLLHGRAGLVVLRRYAGPERIAEQSIVAYTAAGLNVEMHKIHVLL